MELLIIPLALTLISAITPKQINKYVAIFGALASVGAFVFHLCTYCTCMGYVNFITSDISTFFGLTLQMGYDGVGLIMIGLTNVMILLILLSNFNRSLIHENKFVSMVFMMQFALLGVFTANDGLLFYIFWEITLIPVFLIALWYGSQERKKALIKFFVYTFIGSLAMLGSLMYLKSSGAESFSYEHLKALTLSSEVAFWIMGGFMLAFAIKIPLFPFHSWQPDTYTISPMAGTMLLSALMLKMAFFGMFKWMIPLAPEGLEAWTYPIMVLSVIGILYAAIIALKHEDIKKVFAFASISHVGLIAAGTILWNVDALSAVILQMINHSMVAVGLFLAAGIIEHRYGTRNLYELGGIAKSSPKFAFWFAVIGFASVSVPFSSGFIGEFLLLKELFSYHWFVGVLAGTTLIFGAVYTLRAYQLSMFGPTKVEEKADLSWNEMLVFLLLSLMILFLGIFPDKLFHFIEPSVQELINSIKTTQVI